MEMGRGDPSDHRLGGGQGRAVLAFHHRDQTIPHHSTFVCTGTAGAVPQVCSRSPCVPEDDSITQHEAELWEPQDQSHRIAGCNALAVCNITDTPVKGLHPGKATCKAHEHRSLPLHSQYSKYVRALSDSWPTHQLLHTHLFIPPRTQLHSRRLA